MQSPKSPKTPKSLSLISQKREFWTQVIVSLRAENDARKTLKQISFVCRGVLAFFANGSVSSR
jgi:hypothetical protein